MKLVAYIYTNCHFLVKNGTNFPFNSVLYYCYITIVIILL